MKQKQVNSLESCVLETSCLKHYINSIKTCISLKLFNYTVDAHKTSVTVKNVARVTTKIGVTECLGPKISTSYCTASRTSNKNTFLIVNSEF